MKPATLPDMTDAPKPSVKESALPWLGISMVVMVLDLWTKAIASESLIYAQPVPVFPGLNWTLLHNTGAAFSFLSQGSGWQRWFFTVLAIAISLVLTVWLRRTRRGHWQDALPLALIIGGALGNVVDRIRLGYVVDFIDVYYRDWHWPAFNIADSAITVGAVSLLIFGIFGPQQNGRLSE